jgi:hypothetical protein
MIGPAFSMPAASPNNRFLNCARMPSRNPELKSSKNPLSPRYSAASILAQSPDQIDAPSTTNAVIAAVHIGTCRLSSRKTPTGMENVTTAAAASYSLLRTKNISDPHALIPGAQRRTHKRHTAAGNKQKVPPLRQPSDAFRPLSRKKYEPCTDLSGSALLSKCTFTAYAPVCQLWRIRIFPCLTIGRLAGRKADETAMIGAMTGGSYLSVPLRVAGAPGRSAYQAIPW